MAIEPIDMIPIIRVHLCLTCEILLTLFCLIEIDRMRTSRKEHVHQVYSVFGERQSRINIIRHGTITNTSLLVREIDISNKITRCNYQCQSVIWQVFNLTCVYVQYHKLFLIITSVPNTMRALLMIENSLD
jgi:hypothetical protein